MTDPTNLPNDCATEAECNRLIDAHNTVAHAKATGDRATIAHALANYVEACRSIMPKLFARAAFYQARLMVLEQSDANMRATIADAALMGEHGTCATMEGMTATDHRPFFMAVGVGDGAANLHQAVRKCFTDVPPITPPTIDTPNRKGPGQ